MIAGVFCDQNPAERKVSEDGPNRFYNKLTVAAVFALLAVIGTIMNSGQVAAEEPRDGLAWQSASSIRYPCLLPAYQQSRVL